MDREQLTDAEDEASNSPSAEPHAIAVGGRGDNMDSVDASEESKNPPTTSNTAAEPQTASSVSNEEHVNIQGPSIHQDTEDSLLEQEGVVDDMVEEEGLEEENEIGMDLENEEESNNSESSEADVADGFDEDDEEEEDQEAGHIVRIRRNLLRQIPHLPRMVLHRFRRQYAHFFGNIQSREFEENPESDEEEQVKRPENITFDQNLPTSHSYLGEMDDCSGTQYIDQESFIVLPILRVPDFILVPGQTLPLNVTRPQDVALLKAVHAREDKTFGVIMMSNAHDFDSPPSTVDLGCTAELRSVREEEVFEIQTMVGIAIGRQRFKIMEKRSQPDGNLVAKVQILNDDELSPPASGARLAIQHKLSIPPINSVRKRHLQHSDRANPAWLTSCPPWLYNLYDVRILRRLLIKELKDWNPDLEERTLPLSPSAFSFWIASHLLITNAMRLFLLKINCSIQRLRCELDLLRKCTVYACIHCGNHITQKQHLFNMSVSGPMDAYVNPSGHIHETLTVYVSQGLVRVSRPSTEHSWFPGYAWTICECTTCGRHIGWKFTATKDSLTPKKFWGLTRSSLAPKVEVDDLEEKQEEGTRHRRFTGSSDSSSVSSGSVLSYATSNWRPMM